MSLQCPKLGWEVEQGDANQLNSAVQVWQEEMTAVFSASREQHPVNFATGTYKR